MVCCYAKPKTIDSWFGIRVWGKPGGLVVTMNNGLKYMSLARIHGGFLMPSILSASYNIIVVVHPL
ncbi:unnamed protein product [Arabidopsis halleri]